VAELFRVEDILVYIKGEGFVFKNTVASQGDRYWRDAMFPLDYSGHRTKWPLSWKLQLPDCLTTHPAAGA